MLPARIPAAVAVAAVVGIVGVAPAYADQTIVGFSSDTFTVRAPDQAPGIGTGNSIVVSEDATSHNLQVIDNGANVAMVAESPCFQVSAIAAACPEDENHTATLTVTPGAGNDSVFVDLPQRPLSGVAHVEVFGGPGGDMLAGSAGNDTLEGEGRQGNGLIIPSSQTAGGLDLLVGNAGRDTLRGQGSSDYLNGAGLTTSETDPNTLDGGPGSDFLDAGNSLGADHFIGGTGGDALLSGFSGLFENVFLPNQVVPDKRGGDTVSYGTRTFTSAGGGVTASLDDSANDGAPGEGDAIDSDVESLEGTIRDDTLTGSNAANLLRGRQGSDTLSGAGGGDQLIFRDGVADHCFTAGTGDSVDADLVDPTPLDCRPHLLLPLSFTFSSQPVDETIPYVTIGRRVRRLGSGRVVAVVNCSRKAQRACSGRLSVAPARRGGALATTQFRAAPGRSDRVTLNPGAAKLRALHSAGFARLKAVSKGHSRRGPTTTLVIRRV